MRCFKCFSPLTANDVCPKCGADVGVYKKTAAVAEAYYNVGLERARVRDLTGAVESLKICLMINKYNINARNLLGLVYSEMGEVVEALSQWVVSKNYAPEDNVAGSYIKKIQSNQNKFEQITGAIKKYNLSLNYAKEGSYDMAVIQLKKIVTANPKFIKAHLLLALIYINEEEFARAKRLLAAVLKIDKNNIVARKYSREIEERQAVKKADVSNSFLPKKQDRSVDKKPLNGNDVILPRSTYREPSNGAITIVYVLSGVIIGAALIWFLIVPAKYKGLTSEYNKSIAEYSEQLSSSNVDLNSLTNELNDIKAQKEALEQQLAQLNGTEGSNKLLITVIDASNSYLSGNVTQAAEYLIDVDVSALPSDSAKSLFNTLSTAAMLPAAQELYNRGMTDYYRSSYDTAAELLSKSYKCNPTNEDAAYYAAKCYVALAQTDNAKKYYQYIVDDFKTGGYYKEASDYVSSH